MTEPADTSVTSVAPVTAGVLERDRDGARVKRPALTVRQHRFLAHMADGLTDAKIAREMGLSVNTVRGHARRLYPKLGARGRTHAVALAYEFGLLDEHRRGPVVVSTVAVPAPRVPVGSADGGGYPCPAQWVMACVEDGAAFARAVGYALRAERVRRCWTQQEMGELVGLSGSGLCRLERAERPVDMSRLVELCAVLGVAPAVVIAAAQADAFPLDWPVQNAPECATGDRGLRGGT